MNPAQAAHELVIQTHINTASFIFLMLTTIIVFRAIVRSGRAKNASQKPTKRLLIELEKDHSWRRTKVAYLITVLIIMLFVAALTYGPDQFVSTDVLKVSDAYLLERAQDRFQVIGYLFITLGLAWVNYLYWLPRLFNYLKRE